MSMNNNVNHTGIGYRIVWTKKGIEHRLFALTLASATDVVMALAAYLDPVTIQCFAVDDSGGELVMTASGIRLDRN
jgi:hypothetical protein